MSVDLSEVPHRVTVQVGAVVEVPLPSFAGSGNLWTARPASDPGAAGIAEVTVRTDPAAAPPGGRPGGEPPSSYAMPVVAEVAGRSPGSTRWLLVLARPFAPDTPTAMHELDIEVSG
jgi:hypothetical protein